jgi:hypothetical protein
MVSALAREYEGTTATAERCDRRAKRSESPSTYQPNLVSPPHKSANAAAPLMLTCSSFRCGLQSHSHPYPFQSHSCLCAFNGAISHTQRRHRFRVSNGGVPFARPTASLSCVQRRRFHAPNGTAASLSRAQRRLFRASNGGIPFARPMASLSRVQRRRLRAPNGGITFSRPMASPFCFQWRLFLASNSGVVFARPTASLSRVKRCCFRAPNGITRSRRTVSLVRAKRQLPARA